MSVDVVGDHPGDHLPVFSGQAEEELGRSRVQVDRGEEKAAAFEERLQTWNAHLRTWEVELEARERRIEHSAKMAAQRTEVETKVGRNERCPCGSGLKYKLCHGLPGR